MKKITSFFEDVVKLTALFSILLLISGYIDLKTHYGYFGVNISQYIAPSEILLTSIDNIFIVIVFLLIQIVIWLLFFDYLFTYTDEDILKQWKAGEKRPTLFDDETSRRFFRNKKLLVLLLVFWGAFMLVTLVTSVLPYRFLSKISIFIFINCWIVMCIYLGGLHLSRKLWTLFNTRKIYHPKVLVAFFVFLPILLLSVWLNSNLSANHLRKYGNQSKLVFLLENNIQISTNDSIRYIGRTQNYLFFWNRKNWQTTIYPSDQIKQVINKS